ncbi:MAG: thiamine-phosphate kinase [Nitrospiraceae bacterium]|nr:MAG: thiamine-phosphate kinase [Nitrospiraceae bacterium]
MQLSEIGEFGLIKKIRDTCRSSAKDLITGIGDDAAAVKNSSGDLLITSDMMIEKTHFDLSYTTFKQLGYKFLAINISDIFAMGGTPEYFVISLGLPDKIMLRDIEELYAGINAIAKKFNVKIIGGDTCSSKQGFILNGTLTGRAKKIIPRSGAQKGDGIYVKGSLGDSAMGLYLLKKYGKKVHTFSPLTPRLKVIRDHLMPTPVPLAYTKGVTSMIDISDGLLIDVSHICDESRVGAVIYENLIPVSRALREVTDRAGIDPLILAMRGGEDYRLLFTSRHRLRTGAVRIGEIIHKERIIVDSKGRKRALKPEGYEHFKDCSW